MSRSADTQGTMKTMRNDTIEKFNNYGLKS